MADDGQIFGLSAEAAQTAKVMASGGFGAAVFVYLRHPGSLLRAVMLWVIGVGVATIFAAEVAAWSGFHQVTVAALLGLLGKAVAAGLVGAIEKTDFGRFIPGGKVEK